MEAYDFSGYATKNDLRCSDGRTIRKNAFKDNDGKKVPLVWNHQHNAVYNVLGHAVLENREAGVYAYCTFNNSTAGKEAKEAVLHGDITAMSIYANQLKQDGGNVLHGQIREVSLVFASANPGASIQEVIRHGEIEEGEAVIYTGEGFTLYHAEKEDKNTEDNNKGDDKQMAEEKKTPKEPEDSEETVADVFNTLTEKQKTVVYALIGQALEESGDNDNEDNEGDDKKVKHNVFDQDEMENGTALCHADQVEIMKDAKKVGSLQAALELYAADNQLQHDDVTASASGFVNESLALLFPEYKDVNPGAPELITYDQGWVSVVMNGVHKTPYSRIRTRQVDIRNIDTLRAKGYVKGHEKALSGNYAEARRTTDPQTVYVKSALNRDDIVDITDFDYVAYQYNIDRLQLNEELAMAIMLGDGREVDAADKIDPVHIRPIWTDDELYTIHRDIDLEAAREELQGTETASYFGDNFVYAEAIVEASLYAREEYKGSGNMVFFCEPHLLNVMTLARDMNGHRLYKNKAELVAALNVKDIQTVEQFTNKTRTVTVEENSANVEKTKKLLGIFVNMDDYAMGATKGGQITHFTQFDIDFNQQKSLLETRCSGALRRIKSAIALEEDVTE